jgi:biopolymer transport protein TolQ
MFVPLAVTTTDIASGWRGDVWDLIIHSGPVVKAVIVLLLLLSVGCWGIMFYKYRVIRAAVRESEAFLSSFWENSRLSQVYREAEGLQQSPLAEMFRTGYMELQKCASQQGGEEEEEISRYRSAGTGTIKRALNQAAVAEQARLERNLGFLATTGSTAPFIGLFGTVWGIMNSFREIGIRGAANLATVAPGISEALIATAFGLVAAIPAVVAYNYFLGRIRMITSEMDNFSAEFLNISERHFESRSRRRGDH